MQKQSSSDAINLQVESFVCSTFPLGFRSGNEMLRRLILSMMFVFCLASNALADGAITDITLHAKSFDLDTMELDIAIEFKIEEGWHIYYREPGDVGLATTFNCEGNIENFEVHWPAAKQHKSKLGDQNLVSNIYENQVIFPIKVIILPNSTEINLDFEIDYAVCSEVCVPRSYSVDYRRKLESFFDKNAADLFDKWMKK